jgi:hypothetical protein
VFGSKISTFLFAIKTQFFHKFLAKILGRDGLIFLEALILISGMFLHLESFSLLNYEANLLIRLFIHMPPEIHLIFIFQRDFNTAGIKFSSFCWIWVGDPIKGFN